MLDDLAVLWPRWRQRWFVRGWRGRATKAQRWRLAGVSEARTDLGEMDGDIAAVRKVS
jgi:hypothetical protein